MICMVKTSTLGHQNLFLINQKF